MNNYVEKNEYSFEEVLSNKVSLASWPKKERKLADYMISMQSLKFEYNISLKMNKYLTLELPYLYNIVNGKPLISKELITFLKRKRGL